uniref:Uncharacterized protein n=1 Tax=Arundo donax TaxID=35708 RepID=A0A0A9A4A7_ARUDO
MVPCSGSRHFASCTVIDLISSAMCHMIGRIRGNSEAEKVS